jgi:acyl-CoA reductase-like NAD-dependent aldehyde dehydrogenase
MELSADGFETDIFLNYIARVETPAENGGAFTSVNPTTGREEGSVAISAKADLDRAVSAAHRRQPICCDRRVTNDSGVSHRYAPAARRFGLI